jgi:pimeloyl-ACP methyl ester carboxylesterase
MDVLGIDRAHFFGHSDGGCIGLHLLLDFPDRITTATLCGTVYDHDGYNAESRNFFTNAFEDMKKGGTAFPDSEFVNHKEKYAKNSPNPEKLLEVLIGQRDCWVSEPNFNARQLSRIHTPVLVIDAGRDQYLDPAHFKVLADAIPTAHRVRYPEMTHDFASYYEVIAKEVAQIAAAPRTARGIQDIPTNSTRRVGCGNQPASRNQTLAGASGSGPCELRQGVDWGLWLRTGFQAN